jgi:hypothetical protein
MLKSEVVFYRALLQQLRECPDYYFMVLSVNILASWRRLIMLLQLQTTLTNPNVAKEQYLGTAQSKQNCIHEEMKSILHSGNAWYHKKK